MTGSPVPPSPRQKKAVMLAMRQLRVHEVKFLPPDPAALCRDLGYPLMPLSALAELQDKNPWRFVHSQVKEEAASFAVGRERYIVYDDAISSPERIRFSIFHELGHLLLEHFDHWDLDALTQAHYLILEEEANIFARNLLCPPPILDLIRGDPRDGKWANLFCLSQAAWQVRLRTLSEDRRCIDQKTADELRIQFQSYMFGRRCRECGEVFTDVTRYDRCPRCGSSFLVWNPQLETREEAAAHRHVSGATAEDLRPRVGEEKPLDLTRYWDLTRKSFI